MWGFAQPETVGGEGENSSDSVKLPLGTTASKMGRPKRKKLFLEDWTRDQKPTKGS